jgi:hypothetical protein
METKMQNKKCDFIQIKLGFYYMFGVDSVGHSGGLLLLWKIDCNITIQNYSRRRINAVVASKGALLGWKFTGFYGHPDTAKISESWDLLRHLNSFQPTPWLCLGDFNEIVDHSEKKGTVIHPRRQMNNFQRALEDARLHDLGFKGPKFTWNNGRSGREFTLERLDRAMANMEWCDTWQEAGMEVMVCYSSDHLPLFLSMTKQVARGRKWRPFRYEVGWSKNRDVKKIIKEAWMERSPDVDPWKGFTRNIHRCRKALKQWVKKSKPVSENGENSRRSRPSQCANGEAA